MLRTLVLTALVGISMTQVVHAERQVSRGDALVTCRGINDQKIVRFTDREQGKNVSLDRFQAGDVQFEGPAVVIYKGKYIYAFTGVQCTVYFK